MSGQYRSLWGMICLNKTTDLAFPVRVACQSEKLANFNYNGLKKNQEKIFVQVCFAKEISPWLSSHSNPVYKSRF